MSEMKLCKRYEIRTEVTEVESPEAILVKGVERFSPGTRLGLSFAVVFAEVPRPREVGEEVGEAEGENSARHIGYGQTGPDFQTQLYIRKGVTAAVLLKRNRPNSPEPGARE